MVAVDLDSAEADAALVALVAEGGDVEQHELRVVDELVLLPLPQLLEGEAQLLVRVWFIGWS